MRVRLALAAVLLGAVGAAGWTLGAERGPEPGRLAVLAAGTGPAGTAGGGLDLTPMGVEAATQVLARRPVADVPVPAAWIGYEIRLASGEELEHEHAFATVHAVEGAHVLGGGGGERRLMPGGAASVQAGTTHVHRAPRDAPAVFREVLLAEPGTRAPVDGAERLFESEPFRLIPRNPVATAVAVTLPADGQTAVHAHAGPALVWASDGAFEYEDGIVGTRRLAGGAHALAPPGTPVQERNPSDREVRFVAWLLLDPDAEAVRESSFDHVRTIEVVETNFDLSTPYVRGEGDELVVTLPRPGTYVFRAVNDADTVHTLRVSGARLEQGTGTISGGDAATLRVALDRPGEYDLFCDVPGHKRLGMDGRIVVRGPGSQADGGAGGGQADADSDRDRSGTPDLGY